MTVQIKNTFGISLLAMGLALMGAGRALAQADCPAGTKRCCDADGGSYVCVQWDGTGEPDEFTDFTFDFTDADKPDISLRSGNVTWTVWSQEGESDTDPDSLGDITVDPAADSSEDFSVKLENKNTSGAGATSVESIVLDGAGSSNWTGGSNITGGLVSSIGGGIAVVEDDNGNDGAVTGGLYVTGSITGPIDIPSLEASISTLVGDYGDANESHHIDIGVIKNGGSFEIAGDFLSSSSSAVTVDIDQLGDTASSTGGAFKIGGDFTNPKAVVTITDFEAPSGKSVIFSIGGDFGGTLNLKNGVPGSAPDTSVKIGGNLLSPVSGDGGKVDLWDDGNGNGDVGGSFILGGAQSNTVVVRGGDILGSSGTFYPCQAGGEFLGTASFKSVREDGSIWAFPTSHVNGSITIDGDLEGLLKIDGELRSNADITITGDIEANSGNNGLVWVVDEAAGALTVEGDVYGHIHYPDRFSTTGDVTIEGDLKSGGLFKLGDDISAENHGGYFTVLGGAYGAVDIDGILAGTIDIGGDLRGTGTNGVIDIEEDITAAGDVFIGGAMSASAEIYVGGTCNGSIDIAQETGSSTLLHIEEGLLVTGKILINSSENSYCGQTCLPTAAGDIRIGGFDEDTPLPDVEFDGKITIYSECDGSEGDNHGDIDIVGCHDDTNLIAIDMCDNNGTVTVTQTDCTNQISSPYWTGEGTCPEPSTCQ